MNDKINNDARRFLEWVNTSNEIMKSYERRCTIETKFNNKKDGKENLKINLQVKFLRLY